MTDPRKVVVTGIGLVCPLADSADGLHRALLEGRSALRPAEGFSLGEAGFHPAFELNGFAPEHYLEGRNLRPLDRTARLATAAARLALEDAGLDAAAREAEGDPDIGLVLGTMFGSVRTIAEFDQRALEAGPGYVKPFDFANSVINAAAGQTAIWHRLRGLNTTLAGGPTAGLDALLHAADLIATGRTDRLLAGGADELCEPSYRAFRRAGYLAGGATGSDSIFQPAPFGARRDGFLPGEAAALLLLEDEDTARARGARILGRVLGGAGGWDPSRGRDPEGAAHAVARVIRQALEHAGIEAGETVAVSASANGSPRGDRAEALGLGCVFNGHRPPVTAVKAGVGECLGAAGALQVVEMLSALADGVLPGIAPLGGADQPDPELPVAAGPEPTTLDGGAARRTGLVTAVGLDGPLAALVVRCDKEIS